MWLLTNWNGAVEFIVVENQFQLHVDPEWPLNDPLIDVIDDSEWFEEPDVEWEAAELEYPIDVIESVSERGEILIISDSKGN